jgi:3-hydroxyisobutyrate dehydrogenase-like beta-hydroxyacid dehydrogenase
MAQIVTLIGFGEAGQAFAGAEGWRGDARAYDRLTDDPATAAAKADDYRRAGVAGADSLAEALTASPLALSLVTADQALAVARAAAPLLDQGALFCDLNSVAPSTKAAAAALIDAGAGDYVDVAILSPVQPARLSAPLLLSGPQAPAAERALRALGFTRTRVVGAGIGQASAIKMIRSVMVKGIEALTAEAMLAAHRAGVAGEVLASLDASDKAMPWAKRADYNLERMIVHGLRRAEEMEEAVRTLEHLGVEPEMTRATVARQRAIGSLAIDRPAEGLDAKIDQIQQGRTP